MIGVLQVNRHEMPEAIKTLQRALEGQFEGTDTVVPLVVQLSLVVQSGDPDPHSSPICSKIFYDRLKTIQLMTMKFCGGRWP